jgi:hypothetical protein
MMSLPSQVAEIAAHCMPEDYKVHPYDVLNGRSKTAFNNVGNRRFRITLALEVKRYQNAPNRQDKSKLILSIIRLVRSCGGHFLTRSKGRWIDIGDRAAREKVGHAFRDMVGAHVAKRRKQAARERPSSPSCVTQDLNDNFEDPLDVFFTSMFLDEYIPNTGDDGQREDQIFYVDV